MAKHLNLYSRLFFLFCLCVGHYNVCIRNVKQARGIWLCCSVAVAFICFFFFRSAIDQHYHWNCCVKLCPKLLGAQGFATKLPDYSEQCNGGVRTKKHVGNLFSFSFFMRPPAHIHHNHAFTYASYSSDSKTFNLH